MERPEPYNLACAPCIGTPSWEEAIAWCKAHNATLQHTDNGWEVTATFGGTVTVRAARSDLLSAIVFVMSAPYGWYCHVANEVKHATTDAPLGDQAHRG